MGAEWISERRPSLLRVEGRDLDLGTPLNLQGIGR